VIGELMIKKLFFIFIFLCHCFFSCQNAEPKKKNSSKIIPNNNNTNTDNTRNNPAGDIPTQEDHKFPKLLHTYGQLALIKQNLNSGITKTAYEKLINQSEAALNFTTDVPADYDVPAFYQNEDGHRAAKKPLDQLGDAAYAMALSYQLSGEKKYADKAAVLITEWGSKNKSISGTDGRLTMMYLGINLLLAADLLMEYPGWQQTDKDMFLKWLENVFVPASQEIRTADVTKDHRYTNWGAWSYFGAISAAVLTNNTSMLNQEVNNIKSYIDVAIDSNGELPEENKRKKSGMWYTYFALSPITAAIYVAKNSTNEDLFHYQSPKGKSIKLALDKFFTYCLNPQSWPYQSSSGILDDLINPGGSELQIPTSNNWPGNLYEIMSKIYQVAEWDLWVNTSRPVTGSDGWIYSSLMRIGI